MSFCCRSQSQTEIIMIEIIAIWRQKQDGIGGMAIDVSVALVGFLTITVKTKASVSSVSIIQR